VTLIAIIGGLVASLSLLWSGGSHLLHQSRFGSDIVAQQLIPSSLARSLALVLTAAELIVGAAGLFAVASAPNRVAAPFAWAATIVLAIFACYLWILLKTGSSAPCGCTATGRPVSQLALLRSSLLAVCAAAFAVAQGSFAWEPLSAGEVLICALASVTYFTFLWLLPELFELPDGHRLAIGRRE
jgi:hypothetical protein